MSIQKLSANATATILLCSPLALNDKSLKPFTAIEWSEFARILYNSPVKEPANLFDMSASQIVQELSIAKDEAERIEALLSRGANLSFALNELAQKSIFVVTKSDPDYPVRLKKVLGKYSPPLFFYCGDLSLLKHCSIGFVGSRSIDYSGEEYERKLVREATGQNMFIVSGGAQGADSIATETALRHNGSVVEFLAGALDKKIRKRNIQQAITDKHLLLLSAVLPSCGFSVGNAMNRNKYIYAAAKATVVIASAVGEGGTWNGAMESIGKKWGKVYVWQTDAYPGNIPLIKAGAKKLPELADISFTELGNEPEACDSSPQALDLFAMSGTAPSPRVEPQTGSISPVDVTAVAKSEETSSADLVTEADTNVAALAKAVPDISDGQLNAADIPSGMPAVALPSGRDFIDCILPWLKNLFALQDQKSITIKNLDSLKDYFESQGVNKTQVKKWLDLSVQKGLLKKSSVHRSNEYKLCE